MKRTSTTSLLLIATLACAGALPAQVSATISGRIQDSTGSAISGATVKVKSAETGATRSTTSDDSGNYRALSLNVGPQEISVEHSGFKTAVRTGINLAVGQEAVVNVVLEVGEVSQTVTVTDEAPLINTTTSPVSGLVRERQIKELPLNGRSFDNLIALNPGAINYALKSPQTSTSNGNTFSVSGRRPLENLVLMNGIEYTGTSQLAVTPGGVSGQLLGIDAVREFNVLTDTYSAEYGKRAGAQVSVITQSGSNALHGSLFEFLRNDKLDARNFFDQGFVPPFRRNQFGGALGGPLKKDKMFLFGNYEGFRQSLALSSVSVVPNAQARQGLLPNAAGVYAPVANLNRNMLQYFAMWPVANGPELLTNGIPSGTALAFNNPKQSIKENFGTTRFDYALRESDSLSASYTIDDGTSVSPVANPLFASNLALRNQVATIQETHIFSPRVLNTFRAGFSRAGFNFDALSLTQFPESLSFVAGKAPGSIVIGGGATTTGVAALTAAGPNQAANVGNRRNLFTYGDTVQISRGRHQFSTGVWFQRVQSNDNTASRQLGLANFNSLTTFLQGTVATFNVVPRTNVLGWRQWLGAWFVQDSIRLHPRLTLQMGLRQEFSDGWNEATGRAANYITDSNGVLLTETRVANSLFTQNNARKLFAPRVGLAWDPFGNGRTAIRAGYGMYYTMLDALGFLVNQIPPTNGSVSFSNVPLQSFLPIVPSTPVPRSCGPGIPQPCTIYSPQGVQQDAKTPATQQWNFTIERQIAANTSLRLGYIGSFGYHGLLSVDSNSIPAQVCNLAAGCIAGGTPGTNRTTVPQGAQYIPIGTRPNPYLAGGFFWTTAGNSSYNALQVDISRRLSRDFQLRGNYTWSKNLDMNSGLTGAQANNQAQMILDRNDLRRDWGPSALNVTHQSTISGHYEMPFGAGKKWLSGATGLTDKLVGGWQWNGIATMLSGFAFTPLVGSNRSGDGDTRNPDRPSVNPAFSGPVIVGKQTQWFNPNAFVLPAAGTYGNLGRGVYNGPGLASVDLSLFKQVPISERVNLQIRAEAFNMLNRTNFATPNTTVFTGTNISASAGLITSTVTTSRQIQFGAKLVF